MNCLLPIAGVEGGATGSSAVGRSARGAGGDVHIHHLTVVTGGGRPEVGPLHCTGMIMWF